MVDRPCVGGETLIIKACSDRLAVARPICNPRTLAGCHESLSALQQQPPHTLPYKVNGNPLRQAPVCVVTR